MSVSTKNPIEKHALGVMNLALTAAQNMSERSGLGWCLVDASENLLTHGSTMYGIESQRLAFAVARHKDSLDHLFITSEPLGKLFECRELIRNLDLSNCSQISVAIKLDDELVDPAWRAWIKNWDGKVNYANSGIAQNLMAGATSVKRSGRPWVIALCASDMSNQSILLTELRKEFGFIAYVINLTSQSRAFIYNSTQADLLDDLPSENNMDEAVEYFEINGTENLLSILQYCAGQGRCNVVIATDVKQLAELMKLDLVDEIVHHIALASPHDNHKITHPAGLDLGQWTLIATDTVGNSVRMRLKKDKEESFLYSHLNLRLN